MKNKDYYLLYLKDSTYSYEDPLVYRDYNKLQRDLQDFAKNYVSYLIISGEGTPDLNIQRGDFETSKIFKKKK